MPKRELTGTQWHKVDDMLSFTKEIQSPLAHAYPSFRSARNMLAKKVKGTTRMRGQRQELEFTDRQLDQLEDAFKLFGRVAPQRKSKANAVARFFRTGKMEVNL